MATFVLCWELGGGLAHLMNLRPLATELTARGHRVVVAARNLSSAQQVFADSRIDLIQAPFQNKRPASEIEPVCTFSQMLHNVGFGQVDGLRALAGAWRRFFQQVAPDVIVFEHAPTALVAARGLPARRALLGGGFCCPPDAPRMPNLRPWIRVDRRQLWADEEHVLEYANATLADWGEPPIQSVAELYHPSDENFLLGFRELDCYTDRGSCEYRGILSSQGGRPPQWPDGPGRRVFAYLKPFPALPQLLELLGNTLNSILIVADGIPPDLRSQFQRPNLHFVEGLLDVKQVARECDLAILNGNFGTTGEMLLAGKPVLQIPIVLEQGINSLATQRLGAGVYCGMGAPAEIEAALQKMLSDDRFENAARAFAKRYAGFDASRQIGDIVERLLKLAEPGVKRATP